MIGGDAAVVERCMPVFKVIGRTFTHIGGNGAGQLCKSCNQLVIVGTLMAISEAFALAKKMNIDPYRSRLPGTAGTDLECVSTIDPFTFDDFC